MTEAVSRKINRLRAGGIPRVLDLFSGCGGLSLGFHAAGFAILAAVDSDPYAAASHARNFHGGDPNHGRARDIATTPPRLLATELRLGPVADAIDVIVGGPPCQAFARVGRPKLREIAAHPQAFRHDPRSRLYQRYLHYVDTFQPLAVLIENVPDVLNHGGQNIAQEICEVLTDTGYFCGYTLINAVHYGVPQMRERMFLIAYRREIGRHVRFPAPSNGLRLPPGYDGSRAVALKVLNGLPLTVNDYHDYTEPRAADSGLPPAVTAEQALGDLPPIDARRQLAAGDLKRGARRFDRPMPYDKSRTVSSFARLMRSWPGFEAPEEGLRDHVIRFLPRDYDLFARLHPGNQYPEAHEHAIAMFAEHVAELRGRGIPLREETEEYARLRRSIVPPYDTRKFPNKWRKMEADKPARTLLAHLGKDGYSHIHYDNNQARTISVREAARLQSFPDGFVFCGTMNPAFRQIGNAVPPLMAKALAVTMAYSLGNSVNDEVTEDARTAAAV